MNSPLPFVVFNSDEKKFTIEKKALHHLKEIQGPIAVITVAGLYRTGKSYILNRLADSSKGFSLGSKVEPCTEGIHIWILKKDFFTKTGAKINVILLDTEGIGSFKKSQTYDIQIFTLAVLLSSIFIYNSLVSIDEGALDKISLVAELTNSVRIQTQGETTDGYQLSRFFPKFLWLVRDFSLKLEIEGKPITANEYLENALKQVESSSEKVKSRNAIRNSIIQYFPSRSCFTLKRPVTNEKLLQRLETVAEDELRPQFLEEVHRFLDLVKGMIEPKQLYGEPISGQMFGDLVSSYVKALNEGNIPVIKDAWSNVLEIDSNRAMSDSFANFEECWAKEFNPSTLPMEVKDFYSLARIHEVKLMSDFRERIKNPRLLFKFEDKLRMKLWDHITAESLKNEMASEKKSEECLNKIFRSLEERLHDQDSFEEVLNKWDKRIQEEFLNTTFGPKKFEKLSQYNRNRLCTLLSKASDNYIKSLNDKHAEEIKALSETHSNEHTKLELLYKDVKSSWLKAQEELRALQEENASLINVVAKFSDLVNISNN